MTSAAGTALSGAHFIGGRRVASSNTFPTRSPIDGRELAQVARGGADEVSEAVAAAEAAFPAWAALGAEGRAPYLFRIADLIEERVEELAQTETLDAGSLLEVNRERMMPRSAANFHVFARYALEREQRTWESNAAAHKVHHEPSGVAALITPWNAPFMLTTWKAGPALAAGCTVVIKPAEWAPLSCSMLADIAQEAELPEGVLNVVQGIGEEAGAALVRDPRIARISFTGSPETARLIGAAAAKTIVPVSFELGGKSPFLVFEDADLDAAAATVMLQYDHAGQICLAGTRLLVQASVADAFLERVLAAIDGLRVGDPREPSTDVGPLITKEHLERVSGFVERAREEGARILRGGGLAAQGGLYYEPTLLSDVRQEQEIVQREVFGPVLTVQTFESEEQALELANGTDYGLAATLFTRDRSRAEGVGASLVAGTVWVNCYFVRDLSAPFGGARRSGIGREGGDWSFDFFCDVKTLTWREP